MKIVLLDRDCNCNKSVQFIMKRNPKGLFHFASLQSEIGIELRQIHDILANVDSIILIMDTKVTTKSTAPFILANI